MQVSNKPLQGTSAHGAQGSQQYTALMETIIPGFIWLQASDTNHYPNTHFPQPQHKAAITA